MSNCSQNCKINYHDIKKANLVRNPDPCSHQTSTNRVNINFSLFNLYKKYLLLKLTERYFRIVGAGLVGATAAIALSKLPDVEVVAFERSPEPRETGAWISMTVSGTVYKH